MACTILKEGDRTSCTSTTLSPCLLAAPKGPHRGPALRRGQPPHALRRLLPQEERITHARRAIDRNVPGPRSVRPHVLPSTPTTNPRAAPHTLPTRRDATRLHALPRTLYTLQTRSRPSPRPPHRLRYTCHRRDRDLTRFLAPCRRAPGLRLAQRAQGQARGRRPPGREARGGGAAASEPHVPQPARRLAD